MQPGPINTSFPISTTAPKTAEQEILEVLSTPIQKGDTKSVEKQFEQIANAFRNLSQPEGKALYERLKNQNANDPLSNKFHEAVPDTSARKLLDILSGKTNKAEAPSEPQTLEQKNADSSGPSMQRVEKGMEGTVMQIQLQSKLSQNSQVDKAKEIASSKTMSLEDKKAALQTMLEKAKPEEFKQLLKQSESWDWDSHRIFNSAMGESPAVMKRIAKELSVEDQMGAVHRARLKWYTDSGDFKEIYPKQAQALAAWMDNTSPEALNRVFDKTRQGKFSAELEIGGVALRDLIKSPQYSILDKLNGPNKAYYLDSALREDVGPDKAPYLEHALGSMKPTDKNATIDKLQNSGMLDKFLQLRGSNPISEALLNGIDRPNLESIREHYLQLAEAAKMKGDNDSSIDYSKRALQVKDWIQNHF